MIQLRQGVKLHISIDNIHLATLNMKHGSNSLWHTKPYPIFCVMALKNYQAPYDTSCNEEFTMDVPRTPHAKLPQMNPAHFFRMTKKKLTLQLFIHCSNSCFFFCQFMSIDVFVLSHILLLIRIYNNIYCTISI